MINRQGDLFRQPLTHTRTESVLPKTALHTARLAAIPERVDPEILLQNRLAVALLDKRAWKPSKTDATQMVCEFSVAELHGTADALSTGAHAIFAKLGIVEDGVKVETLPPGSRLLPEKIRCTLPRNIFAEKAEAMKTLYEQALVNKAITKDGASR